MKKIIIAALAALMTLSVFTGCQYDGKLTADQLTEAAVDLTTAKVGYGLTVDKAEATELVITAAGYSQAAVALPYIGFAKAEVELTTTGKTTVGFLPANANPWDGRMAGDTFYDAIDEKTTKTITIPAGAAFITFGSNNDNSVITVSKITLKLE